MINQTTSRNVPLAIEYVSNAHPPIYAINLVSGTEKECLVHTDTLSVNIHTSHNHLNEIFILAFLCTRYMTRLQWDVVRAHYTKVEIAESVIPCANLTAKFCWYSSLDSGKQPL